MNRIGRIILVVLILVCGAIVWFFTLGMPAGQRAHGPMVQSAYVWQRQWTPGLVQRLGKLGPLKGVVVLGAEITWHASHAKVFEVPLNEAALADSKRQIGLAIRINRYKGSYDQNGPAATLIADVALKLVKKANKAGMRVREVQLDYDCPTSQLAGYRQWVLAVKKRLPGIDVSVTTLPSWMHHNGFGALVRAAGSFVLQVHSLVRAHSIKHIPPLCDAARSKSWVQEASSYGVPFRVALPTYAYMLAFTADGKFIGASSELTRQWKAPVQLRRLSANAGKMAGLIRAWRADRPAEMRGVIWYRLPIPSDQLNWRWPTLLAVMAGKSPHADLHVVLKHDGKGLIDVILRNGGNGNAPMKRKVTLSWSGSNPIASDVLGGFTSASKSDGKWVITSKPRTGSYVLGPGETREIAWMRFTKDTRVHADVSIYHH